MNKRIDLNCDMAEGFGVYTLGNDAAIMPLISSANIACGFHAGDPHVMYRTMAIARDHGVGVGAHPGYPDMPGFGRRSMALTPREAYETVAYQIGAFLGVARAVGAVATHVKIHGAMYNDAAKNRVLADALAQAVRDVDSSLVFVGLAGSCMISAAEASGLRTASEVFADRAYQLDGSLVPRSHPQALHADTGAAVRQVLQMVEQGTVTAITGEQVLVRADSVCLHGDGAHAVDFAAATRKALADRGIDVLGFRRGE